jgi:DNA-binding CsgD family transcriptional regulator
MCSLPGEFLLGRADALGVIWTFLGRAREDGAALLISGQTGVGKTALLEAAVEAARARETRVLLASGVEFEVNVGFAALNQILLPLLDDFHELSDVHRAALSVALGFGDGPGHGQIVVAEAALALLRRAAAARALLVAVDDLQWVDRSSAAVLARIARRLPGTQIGFVAAFRSEADTFFEPSGLASIDVQPLDEGSASVLLGTRFPTLAARVHQRILGEAQGNPLALLELPSALSDRQRAARAPLPTVLPLTRRLHGLFASRVTSLPAMTRQRLLLAALEGTADLRRLSGGSGEVIRADLEAAERARLVTVEQDMLRMVFRHPLVRSTIVEVATSDERRHAHAQLAGLLADEPERRAWHLAEAAIEPDERVAGLLEEVAYRVLRRGDAVGAVTALLRAADLSPQRRDRGRRLAEAAYIGADVTGDLRNVPQLLDQVRLADPELTGSLAVAVAASCLLLNGEGDIDTAHRLLVSTLQALGGPFDANDNSLNEALQCLTEVCIYGGRPELWEPLNALLAQLDPVVPPGLSLFVNVLGDPARATLADLRLLDDTIKTLAGEADPTLVERVSTVALYVDRGPECREALWRVVGRGRDGGAIASAINAMMVLWAEAYMAGRWDETERVAVDGLRLCEDHGYHLLAAPFRYGLALLAAARGDDDTVRILTNEVNGWAAPRGLRGVQFFCSHARGLAALGRGDFEQAYYHAAVISPPGTLAAHVPHTLWVALDLIDAAVHTGRLAEAAAHVRAMRDAELAQVSSRLALVVAGSAAITAPDHGAIELFDDAITTPGADRWPFDLARLQLAYGERLRRMRAPAQSREHLSTARETFERLGAAPWVTRASQELNATGLTKVHRNGIGPAPLTAQENEVARLAAGGLSNKQVAERLSMSHRTVGAHLRQVFAKLGIRSRAGLRDALTSGETRE